MSGSRTASLFDEMKVRTATPQEEEFADLRLFLNILEDIKKDEADDFYDMLADYSRSCISGSSVLGRRIRRPEIANDIDIFVDDRGNDSIKIIKDFFRETNIKKIWWPAYKSRMTPLSETEESFCREATFFKTNSSDYEFGVTDYNLNTYRIRLGKFITLNFILLRNKEEVTATQFLRNASISESSEELQNRLACKNAIQPFSNSIINQIFNLQLEDDFIDLNKGSSFVLEYIEKSFDFQELKYVYDFKNRSFRDIHELNFELCDQLLTQMTTIESTSDIREIMAQLVTRKTVSEGMHLDFVENYSNPDIVTVAGRQMLYHRFSDINHIYKLDSDLALSGAILEKTSRDFSTLNLRIRKYQDKGFGVADPESVLVNLHFILAAATLGTLLDPDIGNIERQAIFDSSDSVKKKYLFLNKLKVLIKDNIDNLGMEIVTPEVRKRDRDQIINIMDRL